MLGRVAGGWAWSPRQDMYSLESTLRFVNGWTLTRLTEFNRAILAGKRETDELSRELNGTVLARLPGPHAMPPHYACQLLVLLGLWGASVARHRQQRIPGLRACPESSLDGLLVGAESAPFLSYFRSLAEVTTTGHPDRDAYSSLIRWNAPTVRVRWDGELLAVLPGVFTDDAVRTYTGDDGEARFVVMLKRCEAAQRAANAALEPLSRGWVRLDSDDAVERVRVATAMLAVVRRLLLDFVTFARERGLPADHYLQIRQEFAVHWRPDDVPPSEAHDVECLKRDILLGVDMPGYAARVHQIYPGLLGSEQECLKELVDRPSVPAVLLDTIGLDQNMLAGASRRELVRMVSEHPCLADYFLLLRMNTKLSAACVMVARTARLVLRLAEARRRHPLAALAGTPIAALLTAAGAAPEPAISSSMLDRTVRMS